MYKRQLQLDLTAIKPRLVPRRLRCAGMISMWSAWISGTTKMCIRDRNAREELERIQSSQERHDHLQAEKLRLYSLAREKAEALTLSLIHIFLAAREAGLWLK